MLCCAGTGQGHLEFRLIANHRSELAFRETELKVAFYHAFENQVVCLEGQIEMGYVTKQWYIKKMGADNWTKRDGED